MLKQRHYILDIGRIIAILAVMLYHYFSAHTDQVPYGDQYSILPFGYLGARYFFILTGFFIYDNLQRSVSLHQFWRKKFVRLWIPLVVCSILTFAFVHLLSASYSEPSNLQVWSWKNLLFSCTFLEPGTINLLFGTDFRYINGGYWFLSAEIEFLIIVSCCYFIKKEWFFPCFGIVSVICVFMNYWTHALVYTDYLLYFVWGMLCYMGYNREIRNIWWLLPAAILSLLSKHLCSPTPEHLYILSILFLWAIYAGFGSRINQSKQSLAQLSHLSAGIYETFLLHEVIGILCIRQYAYLFGTHMWILPTILIFAFYPIGIFIYRIDQYLIDRMSCNDNPKIQPL